MRTDQRRGETFHELRQVQEVARQRRPQSKGVPPAVARIFRIFLVCLFGLLVMWLLQRIDVPPLFRIVALGVIGIVVVVDILRLVFDE